ncbi:trypsin 3A1-like isoform X2 [Thrips palmi]|uniref:Trypsin 3A1-like isoform X2 n=1 Tax=Thrips palmi TaxID=161013 RepID=A0A6P9A5A9_THRPL|nr:trypsin 3A1-like isoform X2 [Thrips palmi]
MWRPALPALLPLLLSACRPGGAVIGGQQTTIELHPHLVAIDFQGDMVCGGALLSPKTVITAASCFFATDFYSRMLTVRVGSQVRDGGGEAFEVADYEQHPDYNVYWGNHDALLLYLKDEVPFRAEVQPVALAAPSDGIAVGEKLVLAGYGDLYQDEVLPEGEQRQVQAATLAFFNQDLCDELYYFTPPVVNNRACAGGLTSDMCGTRDVGSPIVNWRGRLVGLAIQQRKTCGVPGLPTSFSNLAHPNLNQWVMEHIK